MKKVLLLGASGSIGKQTIDIINKHNNLFDLVGFSVKPMDATKKSVEVHVKRLRKTLQNM